MGRWFEYCIYDCEKGEWLPGSYRRKALNELLGVTYNPSNYAESGLLLKKRYKICFVEDSGQMAGWAEEWDEARMKLLGGKDNGKTDNRRV